MATATRLPGVKVGPLNPDKTAEFGTVDARNSARDLVKLHARLYPADLRGVLLMPFNAARSHALVDEEVAKAVESSRDRRGGRIIPEEAEVVGANVRGAEDKPKYITFTYALPRQDGGEGPGRTGKAFIPYDEELTPDSVEAGDRRARIAELRAEGIGGETVGMMELFAQLLSSQRGGTADGEEGDLTERVAELEASAERERRAREDAEERLAEAQAPEPPYEGWTPDDSVDRIEEVIGDTDDPLERELVKRRVRALEEEREKPRKGVIEATEPVELAPVAERDESADPGS